VVKVPGVGERIAMRLRSLGYWNSKDDKPDIPTFCKEKRYDPRNVYPWVNGTRMPEYPNLKRLAGDLQVPLAWLLLGDEAITELRRFEMRRAPKGIKGDRRRIPDFRSLALTSPEGAH